MQAGFVCIFHITKYIIVVVIVQCKYRDDTPIPADSVSREFIGGSIFEH